MKKVTLATGTLLLLITVLIGCMGEDGLDGADGMDGSNGEDGKTALAYSWLGDIWSIYSSDNTIPSVFINGTYYYYASVGTYTYSYSSAIGTWTGYYSIWVDGGDTGTPGRPGEQGDPGKVFWQDGADGSDGADGIDGADGEDMCFELFMYSMIGPSFYEWTCSYLGVNLPKGVPNSHAIPMDRFIVDQQLEQNALLNYHGGTQIRVSTEDGRTRPIMDDESIILMIDSDENAITESGKAGRYLFIHKYIKNGI